MTKVSILGTLSNIQILLKTFISGARVGADAFGNVYYKGRPRAGTSHERRWVIYAKDTEASAVPPEWHGWLHYQTDVVPTESDGHTRKPWQQPPQRNLTATDAAYFPPGDPRGGGKRAGATGDYVAWQPE